MNLEAKLACLKVVRLDQVRLHEDIDPWRVRRLIVRLQRQGILRNPLIVSGCDDTTYNVLDGATRATALAEMGVLHVVVQEASYQDPQICLSRWHHVVVGLPASRLVSELKAIPDLSIVNCDPEGIHAEVSSRRSLFGVITRDGHAFSFSGGSVIADQARMLKQVVQTYRGRAEVHRTTDASLALLAPQYPDLCAIVVFPLFTPDEVTHFAQNESKLPMGITRHIIGGRALGLNIPLDLLSGDQSLEEKDAWLRALILRRIRRHQVRLYEEPTIVFDE